MSCIAGLALPVVLVLGGQPDSGQAMDIAHGRKLLEGVRDEVFSFDDPAFYWFCRFCRSVAGAAMLIDDGTEPAASWKLVMERPGDYRGQPMVLEGVLRSQYAYDLPNREGVGRLHQLELAETGSKALAAVVVTEDPGEIPVRSLVRVKGFFIKVRSFRTSQGEGGAGPLLVGASVSKSTSAGPVQEDRQLDRRRQNILFASVSIMALAWFLLRRGLADRQGAFGQGKRTVESPSEADFDWIKSNSAPTDEDSGPGRES